MTSTATAPALAEHITREHTVRHIFSVDVEEYFQVHAFRRVLDPAEWARYPTRVEASIDLLLSLLAEREASATFFCLGWVAQRHPLMIRKIVGAGHEIASHGWGHDRVTSLTPKQFGDDVRATKALLEDVSGTRVDGYRAPSFSIVPTSEWALDVLLREGYRYDSSLFPIRRPGYGYPGASVMPHALTRATGTILELPPATFTVFGVRLPAAGGGYLRHFPLALVRAAIRQHARLGTPAMLYVHPWELDPGQPRIPVGRMTRFRHYRGLEATAGRVRSLLSEFRFSTAASYLTAHPGFGLSSSVPVTA